MTCLQMRNNRRLHDERMDVTDVARILKGKSAILTGGRTCEGYTLLTFPDTGTLLSDQDFRKVMHYLTSLPQSQDVKLGFVLVVDRRNDKWTSVKSILLKISVFFPGIIRVVFVLKPVGFLQKALSEVSNKLFKEDFSFRLVMCSTLEELHEYVDPGQLTQDLGGIIPYDNNQWIEERMAIEKFSSSLKEVLGSALEVRENLRLADMPNDVQSTLELLRDQGREYQELKDRLLQVAQRGHQLLSHVRPNGTHLHDRLINVCSLDRLLGQLNSTEKEVDSFWSSHRKKLEECLELRRFEQDFRELQANMEANERELASMQSLGDSVSQVDALLQQLQEFVRLTEDDLEKAEELRRTGKQLIAEGHYAVDCMEPKCLELECMCNRFQELLRQRLDVLHRFRDLQERIDKANKWCSQGVELLATLDVDLCTSPEFALSAVQQLATFLNSSREFRLEDPREFHRFFKDFVSGDMKPMLQQVLKRIEDVKVTCEKRQSCFQTLAVRPPLVPHHDSATLGSYNAKKPNTKVQSRYFSRLHIDMNNGQSLQDKRSHVMTELIETEKSYVSELHSIIQGYKKAMCSPDMKDLVPHSLRGKGDILFGNMESLHHFHDTVFLQDLENCRSTPQLVGSCFVHRKESFHKLYSTYCMNKPKSEALRLECASNNAFFKECQRRLNHKLPLDAYLLKPVQRITKYQLLLKDLLKYSEGCGEQSELQEAVETMLQVLKHVNDSMHQVSITGFHGSLADYGRLLLQGMFNVWLEKKKKELRFKPSQRYIFLYEQLILFTKKYGRDDNPVYAFKNALKTSQIGLTENVKGSRGDKRKFEVWLHGRTQVFVIQAPSLESKELWVKHIKQVLLQQFEQMKDVNRRQHSQEQQRFNGSPRVRHTISGMVWESHNEVPLGRRATLPALRSYVEHEDGWSTDDEADIFLTSEVGRYYVALGDYEAVDVGEVTLHEGQRVHVLRVGCAGWWYVRCGDRDGWVPAAYLAPRPSSPSISSQDSGGCATSRISMAGSNTSLSSGVP
ncbi:guanine nucleotide exchange factor DBS-like [Ornithodoros turicata]